MADGSGTCECGQIIIAMKSIFKPGQYQCAGFSVSDKISFMVRLNILSVILVFASCAGKKDNNIIFLQEVNKSLEQSNHAIRLSTESYYHLLENKSTDMTTARQAREWLPKAKTIRNLSDSMAKHINNLEKSLVNEAGFDPFINTSEPPGNATVAHVFYEHKEGQLLHEKLALYKRNILGIDHSINNSLSDRLQITGSDQVSSTDAFIKKYFNGSLAEAIVMLNKIENEIRITEEMITRFFNEKVGVMIERFDIYSTIIGQNTTIAKPGDQIEINAGIGAYSRASRPSVFIDGKLIAMNEEGFAVSSFKAPMKSGINRVPVKILYTDQNGIERIVEKIVEYTVKE